MSESQNLKSAALTKREFQTEPLPNNPEEFTEENVARLIGSVLDVEHCSLRVTNEGIAFLSKDVGHANSKGIMLRYETWCSGSGHVGFQAQHDKTWVNRIYCSLKENWPASRPEYIDNY